MNVYKVKHKDRSWIWTILAATPQGALLKARRLWRQEKPRPSKDGLESMELVGEVDA